MPQQPEPRRFHLSPQVWIGVVLLDDLNGLRRLMPLLGPESSMVVSDQTGVFPGGPGVRERLGFIYRWSTVPGALLRVWAIRVHDGGAFMP